MLRWDVTQTRYQCVFILIRSRTGLYWIKIITVSPTRARGRAGEEARDREKASREKARGVEGKRGHATRTRDTRNGVDMTHTHNKDG